MTEVQETAVVSWQLDRDHNVIGYTTTEIV